MSPLLPWLALGLILGALAPRGLGLEPWLAWWAIGAPLAVLSVWGLTRMPLAGRWGLFAAALLCGGALAGMREQAPPAGQRVLAVEGDVSHILWRGYSQGLILDAVATVEPAGWTPPRRLLVQVPPGIGVLVGDHIVARGMWTCEERSGRAERQESLRAIEVEVQPREQGPRGFAWRALAPLAERRELAYSLLLGRGDPPERADFRASGLMHVLAVSGVHLVTAAALLVWLLRCGGAGWNLRLASLGVLVVGYTWLTGASPATVRACAMALALIAYHVCWREPHRLGPVALAALALVAWDPGMAGDIGFQLSLAAILGICTLGFDLLALRERWLPLRPWPLDRPVWCGVLWLARATGDAICLGLAAGLATAPLVAWYFQQATPWAWATTLLAGIPSTLALWAGLPLIAGAGLWPGGPWEGLYRLVEWSLDALAWTAGFGAQVAPRLDASPPHPLLLCLWPLLFLRLRDGWDLLLRVLAAAVLILAWRLG